ncbi:protein kinase [Metallosphaera tengchongensis]|uniref:Protein kinase n=1 Tax=Metallosphaera tengchongensis TaxID=1532350 RepID=A0A6N0NUP7_9CREN|nr:serine/threonine-protein kinase [Metallosphaera tengchongensis]QKR00604.1 protein kinase [Metallosphaera tengchongensis]
MSYAFAYNDKCYLFADGNLREINEKVKVKDDVIGYLVSTEKDKIKFTKVPVLDCTKSDFSGVLKAIIKEPSLALFESQDAACILPNPRDKLVIGASYDIVNGKVFLRGDKASILSEMDDYQVIKFAVERYKDPEVLRQAILHLSRLNRCEDAVSLFSKLDEKYPEESLAAAECLERLGKELEALRIYSYFSEEKYRELELKLISKANSLIADFEKTGNPKLLYESLSVLPTYDVPAIKLGFYYLKKNKVQDAINMFEEALKRNKSFQNLVILGSTLLEAGENKRALEVLDEAQKIRRTAPLAYLRGLTFLSLNSTPNAMREFAYACREGLVEACSKVTPTERNGNEFDPESWIGYVLYGYEIRDVLGKGGMGYVLLAEKNTRKFAMKVMKREYKMDEFLYEVAKMQEISRGSRYMVRILANFIDENWTDYYSSPPAIVMEFMEGGDLRRILAEEEYSSLRHSVRWTRIVGLIYSRVAEALVHIHKQGYVHADVKPSNILFNRPLSRYGEEAENQLLNEEVVPKLSDFGSAIRTGFPVIHYTPYYAHPSQRFGGRAETYMDVYSFTVSLYVTLTNNFPFPEWLEREMEEAISSPEKRQSALNDFYNVEPRMDYVPPEYREIILSGIRGETTLEQMRRELIYLVKNEYNLPFKESALL